MIKASTYVQKLRSQVEECRNINAQNLERLQKINQQQRVLEQQMQENKRSAQLFVDELKKGPQCFEQQCLELIGKFGQLESRCRETLRNCSDE